MAVCGGGLMGLLVCGCVYVAVFITHAMHGLYVWREAEGLVEDSH